MTLKSALQDVKETTLAAVKGLLGKLAYLASLRRAGRYEHWGMEAVHGTESSERALKTAHAEVVTGVLRTPLAKLVDDLEESSRGSGVAAGTYIERMRQRLEDLLPGERRDLSVAHHLNSVLQALSSLKNRGRAIRSVSSPLPPPGREPQHPADV
jgi:ElaB/YqjD/DUF883 family membrane-anchored ribosome-binding protein